MTVLVLHGTVVMELLIVMLVMMMMMSTSPTLSHTLRHQRRNEKKDATNMFQCAFVAGEQCKRKKNGRGLSCRGRDGHGKSTEGFRNGRGAR